MYSRLRARSWPIFAQVQPFVDRAPLGGERIDVCLESPEAGMDLNLLLVVDRSDASTRAVRYVADFFATRRGVHICLTYMGPRVPAALLETGGSEQPDREERIQAALRHDQDRWTTAAAHAADEAVGEARAALCRAGVSPGAISSCQMSPLDNRGPAGELLLVAEEQGCETIVVGHFAHSWFSGVGGGHLAEQLVREAKGYAVWVID